MAELVFVFGKSGSGKTRSLKGFAEDEIFLVNVMGKRPPFSKKFKYVAVTANYNTIKSGLQKMPCKTAVIDDAGYLMSSEWMAEHSAPKHGSSQFDLYNSIADNLWSLIKFVKSLPEDVIIYMIFHEEENDIGSVKIRTIGKLLDQKVCLEGLVTICLHCVTKADGTHAFITNSKDGLGIEKSPEDMFPAEIENDLKAVDTRIREFWGV